ncbi:T5orf172 domain-containing protein [Tardiphaga sp. OK246]|uniref:DUF4041 domain-containing protein n=1 Tax=Tardiphaga sp. OK246 TaxID=1855307 RepID=UPI000B6A5E87|nr:DUF4041 domain-containing protein [Tardiphaga sp. OK246]SNT61626.1 T5orf172 domain-containing protein [Tardiphaga sp. OK246]
MVDQEDTSNTGNVPWWGARRYARALLGEVSKLAHEIAAEKVKTHRLGEIAQNLLSDAKEIKSENEELKVRMQQLGMLSVVELEARKAELGRDAETLRREIVAGRDSIEAERAQIKQQHADARQSIIEINEIALLQEAGIYEYRHPLKDVVAYESALKRLEDSIKAAIKRDGHAVQADTNWTVNGSKAEGLKMTRDMSKLMLRAFNAEADAIIRGLKPYKRDNAIQRLQKVGETIQRLGQGMQIQISPAYLQLRIDEIELTSDYLQKQAEQKELERQERERLREERKVLQEIERERAKLEKERQHFSNALQALEEKGDVEAAERVREQLNEVAKSIEDVDFRATHTRAGHVYVISNVGSFGENIVKVGMTRRLDPRDRIRELSDASVPFNFDVHALFFSRDAIGIESAMHDRLAAFRVNGVNLRREFFRVSVAEAKTHLSELAGELLEFNEFAEAEEFRQTLQLTKPTIGSSLPLAV